ncbi:DUF6268 family outer membrane beta-barrel protein [Candidatus Neptunochlamydia vexilliferae]|uniref:DUF6268 domain-containing protein n=1 Tax=Candidatus Neptunichlamydia vexilliferae TaxID=1651774 RepID=A0ABS0B2P2_9BACT|nr:DUF6268 family outer membrane beta-barrel protein [Candidatus Neptunochlamydia vexilliferae]MBF5060142.1 hypothetical protein [Candidatus Neptunochlamydia vexilliferae]
MKWLLFLLFPLLLQAVNYTLATDYCFIHRKERVYIDGYFAAVGGADIDKKGFRGSDLHYSEGAGAIFINAYPAEDHALSFEFGYGHMRLDWDKNPAFNQKNFNDAVFSIAYITTTIPDWRWVVNLGVQANLDRFNMGNNAFYRGTVWGRLAYSRPIGLHIGVVGQSGVKSTYLFPILGFDWSFHEKWQLRAIFPLDFSLNYYFAKHWSAALSYSNFGGWYRSFHRVSKRAADPNSMVSVHATGLDLGINLNTRYVYVGVFGGVNFGGWILLRNRHGAKPRYFHYDPAGYVGAKAALKF